MGLLTLDKSNYKAYKGQQLLDIDQNEFDVLMGVIFTSEPACFQKRILLLELEQEYYDFNRIANSGRSSTTCSKSFSLQNISLMSKEGFKIQFQQVFSINQLDRFFFQDAF